MIEFLIYDLKVAVLVVAFYMFYRLLLSHETFHRVNRVVLLLTAVVSFILPLCVITLHKTVVVSGSGMVTLDGLGMADVADVEKPQMALWQTIATITFFAGVVITLGHTLVGILKVCRLISHSVQYKQEDGTVICVIDHDVSPFSFCRYIVLSHSDYEALDTSILAHERGHIRLHHSLDVLLVDTLTALQWFNPAMWMLRQDLRAIHEYEADAAVLSQGINMRQYQYLLIQKAVATCGYSVANGITHSILKNRIHMMLTNKKTNRASWLKLLAMLPIIGAAMALNAETITDYVNEDTQQQQQKKVVKKGLTDGQIKMSAKTIEVKTDENSVTSKNMTLELNADKHQSEKTNGLLPLKIGTGKTPLIIIDGKVATEEQMNALDPDGIDNISVVKNEELKKTYAKHFKADTSVGVIFINTKEYVSNGGSKELVSVNVSTKPLKKENENKEAFDVVEKMPEFPGGIEELMKFLSSNIKYPEVAHKARVQGRVIVQFIIESDGSVSSPKILKSVSEELDAEALRCINAMPKWKPGMQNEQPVRVKYTIPITFRLPTEEKTVKEEPADQ